jgi:hypothetical protein
MSYLPKVIIFEVGALEFSPPEGVKAPSSFFGLDLWMLLGDGRYTLKSENKQNKVENQNSEDRSAVVVSFPLGEF